MPADPSRRDDVADTIGRKAARRLKARTRGERSVWFGFGMFGLVGWAVAIPTVLGIEIGVWLDRRWPGRISWTLTLMIVGVVLGCMNAWFWVKREARNSDGEN